MSRTSHIAPEVADLVDAPLTLEEFQRRVQAPISESEIQDARELSEWFMRKYPTGKERLEYARRKFREWTRPVKIRPQ